MAQSGRGEVRFGITDDGDTGLWWDAWCGGEWTLGAGDTAEDAIASAMRYHPNPDAEPVVPPDTLSRWDAWRRANVPALPTPTPAVAAARREPERAAYLSAWQTAAHLYGGAVAVDAFANDAERMWTDYVELTAGEADLVSVTTFRESEYTAGAVADALARAEAAPQRIRENAAAYASRLLEKHVTHGEYAERAGEQAAHALATMERDTDELAQDVRALAGQLARAEGELCEVTRLVLNAGGGPANDAPEGLRNIIRERDDMRARLAAAERVPDSVAQLAAAARANIEAVTEQARSTELGRGPLFRAASATRAEYQRAVQALDWEAKRYFAALSAPLRARGEPAGEVGVAAMGAPKPWESLTDAEVNEWAPRGPYSWCIDGDEDESWLVILARHGAPMDHNTFSNGNAAARYVAWKNREHAAALPARPSTPAAEGEP